MTRHIATIGLMLAALAATTAHAQQVQAEGTITLVPPPPAQPPPAAPQAPRVYVQPPAQPQQPPGGYYPAPQQPPYYAPQQPPYYAPQQPPYYAPQQPPYYAQPQYAGYGYGAQQPRIVESTRSLTALWVPGLIIFPLTYVVTFLATTEALEWPRNSGWWGWSWVPLVGPWFMVAEEGINSSEVTAGVVSGLLQLTGLVMLVAGLCIREPVQSQRYARDRSPQFAFDIAPTQGGATASISLTNW